MKQLFCLAIAALSATAGAVSFEDIIKSPHRITISPVLYNSVPVREGDAAAVCALAGYQLVESVKKKFVRDRAAYYSINTGGWGGPSVFGTFSFEKGTATEEVAVLDEVTCSRKYQAQDVKFE